MVGAIKEKSVTQIIGLLLGLVAFAALLAFPIDSESAVASHMAAVAALMAVWWMTDAIPMGATSLVPIVLFPILGIMSAKETAPVYYNNTIFLFLGGFLIAVAMEAVSLHKRISLSIINFIGGGPGGLILGFMLACWGLSMFISNTATVIMMLPIGLAVISKMEETVGVRAARKFGLALLLSIAYSSSIGGIATFVGTVPNLVFREIYRATFPDAPGLSFGSWMIYGVPLSAAMLFVVWFVVTRLFYRSPRDLKIDDSVIVEEKRKLGPISYQETVVLIVFAATGLLWIFRKDIDLGDMGGFVIPGWSGLFEFGDRIDDGTIAILSGLLLFLLPAKRRIGSGAILDLEAFKKIPWETILLFGGGFALAKGFQVSGLSQTIGETFEFFKGFPPLLLVMIICAGLTFLTELTSNTATTQTLLPILASIAIAMGINPLILMIPATFSASFAFMLPVATPPNAIIFGSGRISINEMVRPGIFINIIGIFVCSLLFYYFGTFVFGIDFSTMPAWAG